MTYIASDPKSLDSIELGVRVRVPEWKSGSVIGWTAGVVIEMPTWDDGPYLVRLSNGTDAIYYAYSIGN